MKLAELIRKGVSMLDTIPEDAANDAKLLAMHVFNMTFSELILSYSNDVTEENEKKYLELVEKRATHYPLQYIIGKQCFLGYDFYTAENVLIPRPETELLVLEAFARTKDKKKLKLLDMCCGSGCIGIGFLNYRKDHGYEEDKAILADISDYAYDLSDKNAEAFSANCDIIKSDLFSEIEGRYDLILSNPPYIKSDVIATLMSEVKDFEPMLALDGGMDGLYFYRKICEEAGRYLDDNGILMLEIGYDQGEDIRSLLVENGFSDIEIKKDYAKLDRIAIAYKRK